MWWFLAVTGLVVLWFAAPDLADEPVRDGFPDDWSAAQTRRWQVRRVVRLLVVLAAAALVAASGFALAARAFG